MQKQALTYDDIQLIPRFSEIETRANIHLKTRLSRNYDLAIPIISSCMDTVTETEMAIALMYLGGVGCIHRFMPIEQQANMVIEVDKYRDKTTMYKSPIMAAIGATGDYLERAQELVIKGCDVLLIDVAHGHHLNVKNALKQLKTNLPTKVDIIGGSIATREAAYALIEWGVDGLRVGIGGGSICSTRIQTGFGVPNVTSIEDVVNYTDQKDIPIIADGGIKSSGDIVKALAVGANSVMLGSLLAGTKESPGGIIETPQGLYKRYRGSASLETKITHLQDQRNVEGVATTIPFKGGVKFIVSGLTDGIRSGLSYAGVTSIELLQVHTKYNIVTSAGVAEANPHILK